MARISVAQQRRDAALVIVGYMLAAVVWLTVFFARHGM